MHKKWPLPDSKRIIVVQKLMSFTIVAKCRFWLFEYIRRFAIIVIQKLMSFTIVAKRNQAV